MLFKKKLAPQLAALVGAYPDASDVKAFIHSAARDEREAFARLWLCEGIPKAFEACPAAYECMREFLAHRLEVHARDVGLVGSGRIGYSLAPKKFGTPLKAKSDLDLLVVSERLFAASRDAFFRWADDVGAGRIKPRSNAEALHWPENLKNVPGHLARGFIDPKYVPTFTAYRPIPRIIDSLWRVERLLKRVGGSVVAREANIRVYKDWDSALNRMTFNLMSFRFR